MDALVSGLAATEEEPAPTTRELKTENECGGEKIVLMRRWS